MSESRVRENRTHGSIGGRWRHGTNLRGPLVPGRCAEKRHHNGPVGTSTAATNRQASGLPHHGSIGGRWRLGTTLRRQLVPGRWRKDATHGLGGTSTAATLRRTSGLPHHEFGHRVGHVGTRQERRLDDALLGLGPRVLGRAVPDKAANRGSPGILPDGDPPLNLAHRMPQDRPTGVGWYCGGRPTGANHSRDVSSTERKRR
jgi:hypothetical protein